jgi:hypothetical protein
MYITVLRQYCSQDRFCAVKQVRTDSKLDRLVPSRRQQEQSVSEAPATPTSPATSPSSSQKRLLTSVTC